MTHEDLRAYEPLGGSRWAPGPLAPAAVRDRDATLKVYLWDASHDRRGGPAPVSRMSGSCGAGKRQGLGRSRVGSRVARANRTGARDGATQWGASPRRETRRERDAESRRLSVSAGCRLTARPGRLGPTDLKLIRAVNPQVPQVQVPSRAPRHPRTRQIVRQIGQRHGASPDERFKLPEFYIFI